MGVCRVCGQEYFSARRDKVFCSRTCKSNAAHKRARRTKKVEVLND